MTAGIAPPEGTSSDDLTFAPGVWQTLAAHQDGAVAELEHLLAALDTELDSTSSSVLRLAARYHDAGKAHEKFQETLLASLSDEERQRRKATIWAKADGRWHRHARRYFRHELASALAVLQSADRADGLAQLTTAERDLVAYLVAAHHGRVRLTIRAMPTEQPPRDNQGHVQYDRRFALGIWDGEDLPETDLGGEVHLTKLALDLSPMELGTRPGGGRSWQTCTLALRDAAHLGPFRLAYLEMLLRTADARSSADAKECDDGPAN